jgi:hypothetical protein
MTDDQIKALMAEAVEHGDAEQVRICKLALRGGKVEWERYGNWAPGITWWTTLIGSTTLGTHSRGKGRRGLWGYTLSSGGGTYSTLREAVMAAARRECRRVIEDAEAPDRGRTMDAHDLKWHRVGETRFGRCPIFEADCYGIRIKRLGGPRGRCLYQVADIRTGSLRHALDLAVALNPFGCAS